MTVLNMMVWNKEQVVSLLQDMQKTERLVENCPPQHLSIEDAQ